MTKNITINIKMRKTGIILGLLLFGSVAATAQENIGYTMTPQETE